MANESQNYLQKGYTPSGHLPNKEMNRTRLADVRADNNRMEISGQWFLRHAGQAFDDPKGYVLSGCFLAKDAPGGHPVLP